jgi:hypothetical protein
MWQAIKAAARWIASLLLQTAGNAIIEGKQAVASMIVFKGKSIPVADVAAVANAIVSASNGVADGRSGKDILAEIAPTLLGVGEDVASMFVPGAGAAIEVIAWVVENSRPMTQQETNAWMDRFGAGTQS